jgi:hypothetical protein
MAKRKKIELENIPEVLEKIATLVNREVETFSTKPQLSIEESKILINYASVLSAIYKDYRAEVAVIEKDIKTLPKEEILKIVKAENS